MTDAACFSFVQLCLQIRASALLRLWPRSFEFFRRPELICHRSVADHAHRWVHVVDQMVVEICPCRQEKHENVDLSMRLLFGLLERWQRLPAIQQVSSMLFPTVNCPHLESEHRFHHCPCRQPTPRVPLVRIVANRPDQWCIVVLVLSVDSPPRKCPTVRTKQIDFVFSLPQMWVWTVPSDDEDADFVRLVLARLSSRHDQEESQVLKTHVHSCARKQTHD